MGAKFKMGTPKRKHSREYLAAKRTLDHIFFVLRVDTQVAPGRRRFFRPAFTSGLRAFFFFAGGCVIERFFTTRPDVVRDRRHTKRNTKTHTRTHKGIGCSARG